MRIHEVCARTGLTKKAINWYEQQGLINVNYNENGYRTFSEEDVARLQEIYLLRKLDIAAKDIKDIVGSGNKPAALQKVRHQKQLDADMGQNRLLALDKLIAHYDAGTMEEVEAQLEEDPIGRRLMLVFPGFWGEIMLRHFTPYLQDPLTTPEQLAAYQQLVNWLDDAQVKLPLAIRLQNRLMQRVMPGVQMADPGEGINKVLYGGEAEVEKLRQTIRHQKKWYVRLNPIRAIFRHASHTMRKRLTTSGYYDHFIPAMRAASPSYNAYSEKLEEMEKQIMEYT